MHGDLDLLERREQQLHSVRQGDGARGVGQQKGSGNEQDDAQHHLERARDALPCHDPAGEHRCALGIEDVEQRCQRDYKQHGLEPLEDAARLYLGCRHAPGGRRGDGNVGYPA